MPPDGIDKGESRRTLGPLIQPVIERVILPAASSPLEDAGDYHEAPGVAQRESRSPLEPLGQQIVVQQTLTPVALLEKQRPRRDRAEDEPGSLSPLVAPLSFDEPARPAIVVAQPRVRPAQRVEPAMLASAEPAPRPTPTINVTIGRIEVRATSPPAPTPKKQRPRPPVMSLDDYLHQRNGGGPQ